MAGMAVIRTGMGMAHDSSQRLEASYNFFHKSSTGKALGAIRQPRGTPAVTDIPQETESPKVKKRTGFVDLFLIAQQSATLCQHLQIEQ